MAAHANVVVFKLCELRETVFGVKSNWKDKQDPIHTTPFSNENDTVLFRIRLLSTLQRSENRLFRKRSPEWNDLKTVLFENAVFPSVDVENDTI